MQRPGDVADCAWLCLGVGDIRPEFGDWGALMGSAFLEAITENTDFEGLLVTDLSPGATKFCPASPPLDKMGAKILGGGLGAQWVLK